MAVNALVPAHPLTYVFPHPGPLSGRHCWGLHLDHLSPPELGSVASSAAGA